MLRLLGLILLAALVAWLAWIGPRVYRAGSITEYGHGITNSIFAGVPLEDESFDAYRVGNFVVGGVAVRYPDGYQVALGVYGSRAPTDVAVLRATLLAPDRLDFPSDTAGFRPQTATNRVPILGTVGVGRLPAALSTELDGPLRNFSVQVLVRIDGTQRLLKYDFGRTDRWDIPWPT